MSQPMPNYGPQVPGQGVPGAQVGYTGYAPGAPGAPVYGPQMPVMPGYGGWGQGAAVMPQVPMAPQGQPMPQVNATLKDFTSQPATADGQSWKFKDMQIGTSYIGIVARPLTDGDVRPVIYNGMPQMRQDGSGQPKLLVVIPMLMIPDQAYPDGRATLWAKGALWTQLSAAMSRVGGGTPDGMPESGAMIQATLTGIRPIPGKNAAFDYQVVYWRPDDPATQAFTAQQAAAPKLAAQAGPQVAQVQQATWVGAPNGAQVAQPQAYFAQPQGQPQQVAPQGQPMAQPQQVMPQGQPQQVAPQGQPQQVAPQGQPQQVAPQGQPMAQPQQVAPQGQPQQVMPQGQPQQQVMPPSGMNAAQAELFAKLAAQQAGQPVAAG